MNKQKFVEYLRTPENLDEQQFEEFSQLLIDHPYFSIAKSIAARAAKNLNDDRKGDLITTAAIYATDRKRLKKYINGDLIFLTEKPTVEEDSHEAPKNIKVESSAEEAPPIKQTEISPSNLQAPTTSDVDQILDELEQDMQELRKSRMHFAEIQNKLDSVEKPVKPTQIEEPEKEVDLGDLKSESLSNLMIDLEALKKEFEKEESTADKAGENKDQTTSSSKSTKPKSTKPKDIVTNMGDGEENDDNEPAIKGPEPKKVSSAKKRPARADRDSRMKVKRSDLDQLMGMKSIPPKAKKEAKTSAADKVEQVKPTTRRVTGKKTEVKPTSKATPKKTTNKTAGAKAEAKRAVTSKAKPVTKKKSSKTENEANTSPGRTKTSASKKVTPKKGSSSKNQDDPANDPATRATRKALLDFGKAEGLSMSVSRASSSKRRRKSKGKSGESGTAKKDDDESGGVDSIIDKFIEENPSISRKTNPETKDDLSKESTSWKDDVASEYLAEIYLKQGNKERAKKIYQTLSLKFPEKKSYFAGLIQKLEE